VGWELHVDAGAREAAAEELLEISRAEVESCAKHHQDLCDVLDSECRQLELQLSKQQHKAAAAALATAQQQQRIEEELDAARQHDKKRLCKAGIAAASRQEQPTEAQQPRARRGRPLKQQQASQHTPKKGEEAKQQRKLTGHGLRHDFILFTYLFYLLYFILTSAHFSLSAKKFVKRTIYSTICGICRPKKICLPATLLGTRV